MTLSQKFQIYLTSTNSISFLASENVSTSANPCTFLPGQTLYLPTQCPVSPSFLIEPYFYRRKSYILHFSVLLTARSGRYSWDTSFFLFFLFIFFKVTIWSTTSVGGPAISTPFWASGKIKERRESVDLPAEMGSFKELSLNPTQWLLLTFLLATSSC